MKIVEESIGYAATKIAIEIDADCIIAIEDAVKEEFQNLPHIDVKVSVFKKVRTGVYSKIEYLTQIRKVTGGSIVPIKELLMEGINKSYIKKGDKVVCVADESIGSGYKGMLFVFDVDKIFFDISIHNLAENVNQDVLEAVIDIALEISREGREGRKIGTAFVIGDTEETSKYIKQLIINPFAGYAEDVRNITNPHLRETIKEFSQLDGVFVLDNNGKIYTGGAYIDINTNDINLPPGFGTRHLCCAALTKKINAIVIVVSQSGTVRVFKEGSPVIRLA